MTFDEKGVNDINRFGVPYLNRRNPINVFTNENYVFQFSYTSVRIFKITKIL